MFKVFYQTIFEKLQKEKGGPDIFLVKEFQDFASAQVWTVAMSNKGEIVNYHIEEKN